MDKIRALGFFKDLRINTKQGSSEEKIIIDVNLIEQATGSFGIGAAYWYTNMYHFINQWYHVHNLSTISKIPLNVLPKKQDYGNLDLPKSQDVVGRLISVGVSSAKSIQEIEELAAKMVAIIKKHV